MLTALMILTAVLIIGIIIGCIIEGDFSSLNIVLVCTIILVFVVVFGWGVIGTSATLSSKFIDITPDVYKTKSAIVLEYENTRTILDDARNYNRVNDSTKYQLEKGYNMYGFEVNRDIIIKEKAESN